MKVKHKVRERTSIQGHKIIMIKNKFKENFKMKEKKTTRK